VVCFGEIDFSEGEGLLVELHCLSVFLVGLQVEGHIVEQRDLLLVVLFRSCVVNAGG
jgi:hypothetical protein